MSKTLGPVALKLGDEVLVTIQTNMTIKDLLEQLDKACKGGRIQDADGFDVTAHYSQDLPEGEYAIKQPTAGGPIAAQFHLCRFCRLRGCQPLIAGPRQVFHDMCIADAKLAELEPLYMYNHVTSM